MHNMKAFFSATDWELLEDRACSSNYFLMLVVNFDGTYVAKVAFKAIADGGRKSTKLNFANNEDARPPIVIAADKEKDVLVIMDCKVEFEENFMGDDFIKRYDSIAEINEKKQSKSTFFSYQENNGKTKKTYDGFPSHFSKPKNISEMTDKEWEKYSMEEYGDTPAKVSGTFTYDHVIIFLNAMLTLNYTKMDRSDPILKIEKEWRSMSTRDKVEDWTEEFSLNIGEAFDTMFPASSIDEYVEFLEVMKDYLEKGGTCHLLSLMVQEINGEIEVNKYSILG